MLASAETASPRVRATGSYDRPVRRSFPDGLTSMLSSRGGCCGTVNPIAICFEGMCTRFCGSGGVSMLVREGARACPPLLLRRAGGGLPGVLRPRPLPALAVSGDLARLSARSGVGSHASTGLVEGSCRLPSVLLLAAPRAVFDWYAPWDAVPEVCGSLSVAGPLMLLLWPVLREPPMRATGGTPLALGVGPCPNRSGVVRPTPPGRR